MKISGIITLMLLGVFGMSFLFPVNEERTPQSEDLKEIIRKAENRMEGESSIASMKITIVRPKYTRDMTLKAWTKGDDYSLMYIMTPSRDQGTTYLKRSKEIWYYLPSVERNIKMPPSMMSQSWMGTDMSNDDLVKRTSMANDFTHKLLGSETIDGHDCHKIQLIPKESADVIWGKIEIWVDKKLYNIMKQKSYDEDMELVNTMNASNVKMMGGEEIPTKMEIVPADKPNQKTVMTYLSIQFNVDIPDHYFTTQYMTKVKP
ncbi:MAG: outer membrane lipoprotein-sorting protein [Crocinitomicaceae bacterium]|nr:outer membrane lipoprotein-sorting protein [Crocinitomicaceae bacterium]